MAGYHDIKPETDSSTTQGFGRNVPPVHHGSVLQSLQELLLPIAPAVEVVISQVRLGDTILCAPTNMVHLLAHPLDASARVLDDQAHATREVAPGACPYDVQHRAV